MASATLSSRATQPLDIETVRLRVYRKFTMAFIDDIDRVITYDDFLSYQQKRSALPA